MKNPLRLGALALFVFMLTACNKDKLPPAKHALTLDGLDYEVASANIVGVSIGGEGHANVSFISSEGNVAKTLNINIEYFTDKPIAGDYGFPQTGSLRYMDDWLTMYTEIDSGTGSMISTNLESGTMSIVHNGEENYTVTIDLTMIDGKVFKGTYTDNFVVGFNNG